jgi:tetratricopeptide (TPR) repeat protein
VPKKPVNYRLFAILGVVLVMAVIVGASQWFAGADARQQVWLNTLPTEALRKLAGQPDADLMVMVTTADRLISEGNGEAAYSTIDKAMPLVPAGSTDALSNRARTLAALLAAEFGEPAQASTLLDALKKATPGSPNLLLIEGEIDERHTEFGEAYSLFLQAASKMPGDFDTWRRAGRAALGAQLYAEAADAFANAVRLKPKDASLHASLANAYGVLAQYNEAAVESDAAARLAPENPVYAALPAVNAATSARTEEEYTTAASMLRKVMAMQPRNYALVAMLAGLQMRFNHLVDARITQDQYLSNEPHDYMAWLELTDMCRRLGDDHSARIADSNFKMLLKVDDDTHVLAIQSQLHPRDAALCLKLSLALHRAGKMREAYSALQQASQLDPGNQKISMMLSHIQDQMRAKGSNAKPATGTRSTLLQ